MSAMSEVQGSAITGPTAFDPNTYLEVGSQLPDAGGNQVTTWPIQAHETAGPTVT